MDEIRHTCFNCDRLRVIPDINAGPFGGHVILCKAKGKALHTVKGGWFCKCFEPCNVTYPEKLCNLQEEYDKKYRR